MSEEMKDKVEQAEEKVEDKAQTFSEQLEVTGNQLVDKVQELVKQGNVRKLDYPYTR